MAGAPFAYLDHLVTVPFRVGEVDARFVLDTGIGPTILTETLARDVGCTANGETLTGKRMSGQEFGVPLAEAPPIALGPYVREGHAVGLLDTSVPGRARRDRRPPVARVLRGDGVHRGLRAQRRRGRDAGGACRAGGRRRRRSGRLERQHPSVVAFLPLALPGLGSVEVEVDMGSDSLILDARHAPAVGIGLDDPAVRRVEGRDETGNAYLRCFTRLDATIHVAGEPTLAQEDPEVMFQEIVYDGLIGDAFLRGFTVTYDLPGARMIFAPRR